MAIKFRIRANKPIISIPIPIDFLKYTYKTGFRHLSSQHGNDIIYHTVVSFLF